MEELERRLKQLIVEAAHLSDVVPDEIDNDTPLFDGGLGLDSIDALKLTVVVRQTYGIRLPPDDDASRKILASVRSLSNFIRASTPSMHGDQ